MLSGFDTLRSGPAASGRRFPAPPEAVAPVHETALTRAKTARDRSDATADRGLRSSAAGRRNGGGDRAPAPPAEPPAPPGVEPAGAGGDGFEPETSELMAARRAYSAGQKLADTDPMHTIGIVLDGTI